MSNHSDDRTHAARPVLLLLAGQVAMLLEALERMRMDSQGPAQSVFWLHEIAVVRQLLDRHHLDLAEWHAPHPPDWARSADPIGGPSEGA
jgi:hypothetical protein